MRLIRCHHCGYEIERRIGVLCPECGTAFDRQAKDAEIERVRVRRAVEHHQKMQTVLWACVLIVYSFGAMVASGGVFGFVVGGISIGIGLVGSMAFGLTVSLLAPRHERVFVRWIWRRWFPILHAPWLMIGPLTCAGALVALPARLLDAESAAEIFWLLAGVAFFGWLLLVPVWWALWVLKLRRSVRALGLGGMRRRRIWISMGLWAAVVVGGSTLFGFGGGQLGFLLTLRIADADHVQVWDF